MFVVHGAGSWQIARAYSTSGTFTWITSGTVAGIYRVTVWVHDAGSTGTNSNVLGSWDTSSNQTYTLS